MAQADREVRQHPPEDPPGDPPGEKHRHMPQNGVFYHLRSSPTAHRLPPSLAAVGEGEEAAVAAAAVVEMAAEAEAVGRFLRSYYFFSGGRGTGLPRSGFGDSRFGKYFGGSVCGGGVRGEGSCRGCGRGGCGGCLCGSGCGI